MAFVSDLIFWQEFEKKVIDYINKFYLIWIRKNDDKKWVDIVWPITIETKLDRKTLQTWNIFIETECNKMPSWIYKYSNVDFLIYGIDKSISLVFEIPKLIEVIEQNRQTKRFRVVNGWDWFRVSWVLIPIQDAKSLSVRDFII